MIINKQLAKSTGCIQKDLWETPKELFDALDKEFSFTLDPCATEDTAKCKKYFTSEQDGLSQSWEGHVCFVNPPYSRGNIDQWAKKCFFESHHAIVVALLPASTSSTWFHSYVNHKAEIRFLKGRVRFVGAKHTAPFSSLIAIWR